MKRKHLLFTLLLALVVPIAALAQVERTATVYNGTDQNSQIPVEASHGCDSKARNQFILNKDELSDIVGKPVTKMTFHCTPQSPTIEQWLPCELYRPRGRIR